MICNTLIYVHIYIYIFVYVTINMIAVVMVVIDVPFRLILFGFVFFMVPCGLICCKEAWPQLRDSEAVLCAKALTFTCGTTCQLQCSVSLYISISVCIYACVYVYTPIFVYSIHSCALFTNTYTFMNTCTHTVTNEREGEG